MMSDNAAANPDRSTSLPLPDRGNNTAPLPGRGMSLPQPDRSMSLSLPHHKDNEVAHPRRNGWSCPWHPLQCLAWFFIFLFALLYFGILGHYVLGYWRIPTFIIPGIIFVILVVAMVTATTINPAEPAVREKMSMGGFSRPKFDRGKFPHVIQNNYCRLCQLNVSKGAKHCRICDKCILEFDHHCKWLNSCVGSRNYKWFLTAVWSALIGIVMFLLYSLALFIVYFIEEDASLLRFNCNSPSNLTACDPNLAILGFRLPSQANPVFPVLCVFCFLLSLTGLVLLGHLAAFHLYLGIKGQSTYDFFVQRRQDSDSTTKPHPSSKRLPLKKKVNRVTPLHTDTAPGSEVNHTSLHEPDSRQASPHMSVISEHSDSSAGIATFGRTPPPFEENCDSFGNLTDEQKLDMAYSHSINEKVCSFEENEKLSSLEIKSDEIVYSKTVVAPERPSPLAMIEITPHPPSSVTHQEREGEGGSLSPDEEEVDDKRTLLSGDRDVLETTPLSSHVEVEVEHHTPSPAADVPDNCLHETPLPHHTPPSYDRSSAGSNDRGTPQHCSPLSPPHAQGLKESVAVSEEMRPIAGRTDSPFHPVHSRVDSPLHSTTDSPLHPLHKRVSFQNLDEDLEEIGKPMSKPRPLPPIGYDNYRNEPLPPISRRLPPLVHGQSDALSLYSGSSQSQLYSHSGSTYSLPLPDPRYSVTPPRPLTPFGGSQETPMTSASRRDGRKLSKKAARHSTGASTSSKPGSKLLSEQD